MKILSKISTSIPLIRRCFDWVEIRNNQVKSTQIESSGWSFVIVTSGNSDDTLELQINSIHHEMSGKEYEIVLVGPHTILNRWSGVRCIPYKGWDFLPGLITHKKNLGVKAALFDKVVICHDYLKFESGWLSGFEKHIQENGIFDICMNIVVFKDGRRSRDWVLWDYPGVGPAIIPYHINLTPYQYISGAYFVARRQFYINNPLKENLRWGEGEDVEWSKRVRKLTRFHMNVYSKVSFLREKNNNDAPWCESWVKNHYLIMEKLGLSSEL